MDARQELVFFLPKCHMNHPDTREHEAGRPTHTTAETGSTPVVIVATNRAELLNALLQLSPGTRNVRVRIPHTATVGSTGHTLRR